MDRNATCTQGSAAHQRTRMVLFIATCCVAFGLSAQASAETVSIKYSDTHIMAAFDLDGAQAPYQKEFQFGVLRGGTLKFATVCEGPLPVGTGIQLDNAEIPDRDTVSAEAGAPGPSLPFFEKAKGKTDFNARVFTADYQVNPVDVSDRGVWRLTLSTPAPVKGCTLAFEHGGIATQFRSIDMLHLGSQDKVPSRDALDAAPVKALPARRKQS